MQRLLDVVVESTIQWFKSSKQNPKRLSPADINEVSLHTLFTSELLEERSGNQMSSTQRRFLLAILVRWFYLATKWLKDYTAHIKLDAHLGTNSQ